MSRKYAARICARKKTYMNKAEAKVAVIEHKISGQQVMTPYRCEICDEWHLASKNKLKAVKKARNNRAAERLALKEEK